MPRQTANWISTYLRLVKDTEPPERYHLWTAITILAAMLGRKCMVRMGPELFFPNLYTVLVGPPAAKKGTAIKYGTELMKAVQGLTTAPDAVTKEQLCQELENAQTQDNINGEMLVHSSIFIVAPELVVFLRENDHERLGYLCQLYDGLSRFEYKTKTSGSNFIVNPALWLLGATTPNWIELSMKQLAIGGGMTSRTIFVYADKRSKKVSLTKMIPFDKKVVAQLVNDLMEIKNMTGYFTVTPDADAAYSDWYDGPYDLIPIKDDRFETYWGRLPGMIIKVAMVLSAAKRDDMTITSDDIIHSIRLFDHIHPQMPKAFGAMGHNSLGKQTELVRNLLEKHNTLAKSEVLRYLRNHLNEWDYQRVKTSLVAERFCTKVFDQTRGEEILCLTQVVQP